MSSRVSVTVSKEVYERFKFYSDVTGRTVKESVEEALNFWMDTAGAAEILVTTGVETVPELAVTPANPPADILPMDNRVHPAPIPALGRC